MIEKFLVSRHEQHYQAWPDLALTASGKLICAFAQCKHHGDRSFARFVTVESSDRGRSWTAPRVLVETSEQGWWNCPRIVRLRDGRMVIIGDHVVAGEGSPDDNLTNWLWFSGDEGATWSGPHPTPIRGIVPDKILELPGGRWLLAAQHREPGFGYLVQRVWWSDDRGATWQGPSIVGRQEGLHLCEASLLPLPDGGVVAFMRENSGQGWDGFKSFSADGGETWEGPYPTVLCGCHRPVAGWLQSGRCLVTYRFLQGGRGGWGRGTQNFFGALMPPETVAARERKEQWARILPLDFDHHRHSDIGYSGWVQFEDGEIVVVTYLLDDWDRGQIRGYRFRESEFGEFAD
ncbi:MAG: exo-alpha-sialidase [Armatimonadetes bacterium]|nr:exo-alpha-sialidase [Armatimonadota bacterium]